MIDVPTYKRARADGQRAIHAYRLARWMAEPKIEIGLPGERPVSIERDGFTVTLHTQYDDSGSTYEDMGYGTFDEGAEDWRTGHVHPTVDGAIPNPYRDSRSPGNGAAFYVPSCPREDRIAEYRKAGASRSVALDMARDAERHEIDTLNAGGYGPTVVGLIVTAYKADVELGSDSVWGIEIGWSDLTRTDGSEYLAEVAEDIIPEAIAEARASLERLVTA